MSRRIGQPVNQVRLTNVAMVRIHKGGKRFEIACYRNKVLSWRQGIEKDIDEVLQTHAIFLNVSKGILASTKDLSDAFGKDDVEELIHYILEKGEYHPSDKEREATLESTYKDIATIVSEKSVNPASNRPYTVKIIMSGMKEIHFAVNPTRSAKQQALEVIRRLKDVMPIERAKMHLRAICTIEDVELVLEGLKGLGIDPQRMGGEGEDRGGQQSQQQPREELDMLVDPGLFRAVDALVRSKTEARGSLQVVELNVQQEGEADVDLEIARKEKMRRDEEEEAAAAAAVAAQQRKAGGSEEEEDDDGEEQQQQQEKEEKEVEDEGPKEEKGGGSGGGGGKKSKASKRREKEERIEREMKKQEVAERRKAAYAAARADQEDHPSSSFTSTSTPTATSSSSSAADASSGSGGSNKRLACNTCRIDFGDTKEYREHYRTDWHRYNLKLKEKGGGPVSEKEFELCDADELFFTGRR